MMGDIIVAIGLCIGAIGLSAIIFLGSIYTALLIISGIRSIWEEIKDGT